MAPSRFGILGSFLVLVLLSLPAAAGAAPSCAEGPETAGETIVGTPCADTIRLPRNVTTVFGEGGDDTLFGQRGNDSLFGGEGADRLYGGIGDDRLRGGPGNDLLAGGFGADSLDGEGGDDVARGDATIDAIGFGASGTRPPSTMPSANTSARASASRALALPPPCSAATLSATSPRRSSSRIESISSDSARSRTIAGAIVPPAPSTATLTRSAPWPGEPARARPGHSRGSGPVR